MPPADSTAPRYRLDRNGVLTAPDGATYTQGTPAGRGNGFFDALSAVLRQAAQHPGLDRREAARLRARAGASPAQLMRLNGLPGDPAERDSLFRPPPMTRRPGVPAPSTDAREGHLRRHLTEAPWGPEADRAMAEWAAGATGTTVTLIEENGTAHTYPGPAAEGTPHLRLRRRGGDFVPLTLRTPAPAPKTPKADITGKKGPEQEKQGPEKQGPEQATPAPKGTEPKDSSEGQVEPLVDVDVHVDLPVPPVPSVPLQDLQGPSAVPSPPSPGSPAGSDAPGLADEEEAYELSTLSGAGAGAGAGAGVGVGAAMAMDMDADGGTDTDSDLEMDLDSGSDVGPDSRPAPEEAAVRTGPENEFAAEFADLFGESELRVDALLDVLRRRNELLGGFPDVAFDGAFTEQVGIGVPEALDQAEQEGRLQPEEYEELREALGLGSGGPFTQTRPTGTSERDREVTLRMLDRVARLVKEALRKEDRWANAQVTPHIAVGLLPDGSLGIAGNTGAKALTSDEAALVEEELRWFVTGQDPEEGPGQRKLEQWSREEEQHRQRSADLAERQRDLDRRREEQARLRAQLEERYESNSWNDQLEQQWNVLLGDEETAGQDQWRLADEQQRWLRDEQWLARRRPGIARETRDRTKLRALATGWYRLYHPESPELDLIRQALANPRILNVSGQDGTPGAGSHGSEHGELTLLGHWVDHWENHPGTPDDPQVLHLGGFKMACASCDLAYQAVNEHIGSRLGHRVQASGTHGMFFPGWRMPQWMARRPELLNHIRDNAESIGAYLDHNGVLQGDRTESDNPQYPATSSSEYESGDEELDPDASVGSPAPDPGTVAPRLPRTPSATRPGPPEAQVTRPVLKGPRDGRPRFVVRSGFDARRFWFGGEQVTDLTVRLALRGPEGEVARVRDQLEAGVREFLNDPAYRLPNGDRLHVTVEHVGSAEAPHLAVEVAGRDRVMDQGTWWADADPVQLVHELTHQLGLRDEYRDADSAHRPHVAGSLLGDPKVSPDDASLAAAGLRGRHMDLLGVLIGDVAPGTSGESQEDAERDWDTARKAATGIPRQAVWVDPVSLPQPADTTDSTTETTDNATTATAEVAPRVPGDPDPNAAPPAPEPTFIPFKSGTFEFTNVKHTEEKYRDKAVRIIELLRKHDTIRDYIGGRPCRITLRLRTTETPANVTDRGEAGVDIELASYYFEKYGIGHIMGMLAHEIGLHPLASRNGGIPDEEEMFRDIPLPVPGLSDLKTPRTMSTEGAGQADHIMAAFPSSTRHRIYRDIVVDMAKVLARDARTGEEGARPGDVTDLVDCYLMDLASIAITNDYRMNAAREPGNTAKVYNAYKEMLQAQFADDTSLRALLPSNKSIFGVINDFRRIGTYIGISNRGDSIQQADAT
jgi:hypothetical protein